MKPSWRSRLIHPSISAPQGFRSLVTPVYRGSTTLFESAADVHDEWDVEKKPYAYGLYGTPTTIALAQRIADLEGGGHTFITPGGQAAIALIYFAFARAGSHVLVPESIYGPNRELATDLLKTLNMEVEFYDPLIGSGMQHLLRQNTTLVWCESPGSVTMEIQDLPAIAAAVHAHGKAVVALDNTYAAGILFDAFRHGADVTMQALTKYVGGHSDLLLGSVTTRQASLYKALGETRKLLGMGASPDDCSLALRGLETLGVRLDAVEKSTLAVADHLEKRPEVERVLHPALPSCPGHEIWKRDFAGSAGIFSIIFRQGIAKKQATRFIDACQMFQVGYSWGGVASLLMTFSDLPRILSRYEDRLVRLCIGLEETGDLLQDLDQALDTIRQDR